ncbi:MAG: polyprenyl synthetase family protein [Eubacteriales bacterium]
MSLEDIYAGVTREIAEVDEQIRTSVANKGTFLSEVTGHFLTASGKKLRPAIVLLAGKACGGNRKRLVNLAASLELIHMASLVHDDIIDRSVTRRGNVTANTKWGSRVAVLLGDYFYARALGLAAPLGERVNRALSEIVGSLVEGEFNQLENRLETNITETYYLETVSRKTARFISLCCRLGAEAGKPSPEVVDGLSQYGFFTGMAYQIRDDILDLTGCSSNRDREHSQDLKSGVITLPVVHAVNNGPRGNEIKELIIKEKLTVTEIRKILQCVRLTGSIEYSAGKAREYICKAKESLQVLPAGRARDALTLLAEYINDRVS